MMNGTNKKIRVSRPDQLTKVVGRKGKEIMEKRGQSLLQSRNFNGSIRPNFKKQSYSYSESSPRYENMNIEESKRRPKRPDNRNVRRRYMTPKEA